MIKKAGGLSSAPYLIEIIVFFLAGTDFSYRYLDAADRGQLAGVSFDRFGRSVGGCRVFNRIPALVLAPFAGVADRWNRHRTVSYPDLVHDSGLNPAGASVTGWVTIWEVIVLSLFLGAINARTRRCGNRLSWTWSRAEKI